MCIKKIPIECFAVFGAELEYVTHFDAASDLDRLQGIGRTGITLDRLAQIMCRGFRKIPTPVDSLQMKAVSIGSANEV